MKLGFVLVMAAGALTGCATNKDYLALLTAQQAVAVQNAEAAKARYMAMSQIAQTGDASSRTAAVMAMAMVQAPNVQLPPPPESEVFKWASVLVPAITNLGANFFTYRLGAINSNNAAQTTTSAYNAFSTMATNGFNAVQGTANAGFNSASTIASFIQAPQANVTTTTTTNTSNQTTNNTTTNNTTTNNTTSNTTSNTTNTTNSNNTTRTCQGGNGATGGAGGSGTTTGGTGAPGGAGGGANC